ncbi:restriction endonuclease subunit S [Fusibacter paucivorans]|uniref:Restriction endonuclease subunit S n=1 Tax=Fusibacter paucivorans TaxID=76009 RepID=A0ABS5PU27_9FIRM|nr:restriction endonuclease subunit S [Fusibacter paucivorans]MBS7528596.1 restriction endonuclease subunit S [Fusibacter paucivorans]
MKKIRIGELTKIRTGKLDANASSDNGQYPFFTCSREPLKISSYSYDCECVLVAGNGDLNVKYYSGKFDAYQRTYIIEDNSSGRLYMPYLYYFMEGYIEELRTQSIGGVIKYIKLGNLTEAQMYLPSINEQKQIVNILEKNHAIIEKKNEQLHLLDTLIKSRFVEMFGDPVSNPFGWKKSKLSNECEIVTGNTPSRKVSEYYGDYIEWIKSDNITTASYLTTAKEFLSEVGLKVGRSVESGSILMTCIAGSIRSIANVAIADRKVAFNQQINAIVPNDNNTWFMYIQFMMSQQYIRSTINMSLKGILSKGALSDLEFIFPPIEKQNEFAEFVQHVDKLKLEVQKSLDETQILFDSLLQKYFE